MNRSDEIVETMAKALIDSMAVNDASLPIAMRDALRVVKAEGWELVKLPDPVPDVRWHSERRAGWNNYFDEIEWLEDS